MGMMEPNVQACAQSNVQKIICIVEEEWMLMDAQCLIHVRQCQVPLELMEPNAQAFALLFVPLTTPNVQ